MILKRIKGKISDQKIWSAYADALEAFNNAVPYRNYLPDDHFKKIVKKYADLPVSQAQDYSLGGMESLAQERVKFISEKVGGLKQSVLEIGPGNGYVLKEFKEQGVGRAVAVDIVDTLSEEVKKAGVECILTSADDMKVIPDKSFDMIVSWSALEHIPNPQKVFDECLRILKPGGYLFFRFGPLYYSPWGYHHYSTIRAPYLHLLFPEKLILDYAKEYGKYNGYIPWTNGCHLNEYDSLKRQLPYGYALESYTSGFDHSCCDIISKYPEVFKSKNVSFESFFVDWIEISLWRIE
jgi:ubiquinone/menaquinone biosynthesis C-methylase UbiE